jgi:predicted transcriptional regulator
VKAGLTLPEVSKRTGRSVRTIRRWIAEGHLKPLVRAPHEPVNTPTLIEEDALERFLELARKPSPPDAEDAEASEARMEEVYARLRSEMLPMIQELHHEMDRLQTQLQNLQEEHGTLKEKLTPPPKAVSPWRKLLGVE